MSLRMRLSAMTALAFLLTVVLATVTVGGPHARGRLARGLRPAGPGRHPR